jgi:hypothetical protein
MEFKQNTLTMLVTFHVNVIVKFSTYHIFTMYFLKKLMLMVISNPPIFVSTFSLISKKS